LGAVPLPGAQPMSASAASETSANKTNLLIIKPPFCVSNYGLL
jgi:hypothetical protein